MGKQPILSTRVVIFVPQPQTEYTNLFLRNCDQKGKEAEKDLQELCAQRAHCGRAAEVYSWLGNPVKVGKMS